MTLKEKFLEKAKNKFGDKFDYSKVNYVNSTTPVTVICPIHGEFEVKPVQFLQSKYGCKKCANEEIHKKQRWTTEIFIQKAKEVWGERYTYEHSNYVNSETKVIVTCPIHGDFETRVPDFLRKHGCPKCKSNLTSELNKKTKRSSLETFINKAKQLYGNLFSYENVNYVNSRTKIIVHSNLLDEDFVISPAHFIQGEIRKKYLGLECFNKKEEYSWDNDYFIKIASLMRPEYDYSETIYTGNKNKIKVICPKHGEFYILPVNLLYNNEGCPKCSRSKGEEFIEFVLNDLKIPFKSQYKIEYSERKFLIDYCIIKNNKIIFIEYNGRQHYEPIEYFGGQEAFEKQQYRDNLLKKYCEENDIVLLEYKYNIPFYKLYSIIKEDIKKCTK